MKDRFMRLTILLAAVATVAIGQAEAKGRSSQDADRLEEQKNSEFSDDNLNAPNEISGDTSINEPADSTAADDAGGAGSSGSDLDAGTGEVGPANDASINGADAENVGDVDGADGGAPGAAGDSGGGAAGQ